MKNLAVVLVGLSFSFSSFADTSLEALRDQACALAGHLQSVDEACKNASIAYENQFCHGPAGAGLNEIYDFTQKTFESSRAIQAGQTSATSELMNLNQEVSNQLNAAAIAKIRANTKALSSSPSSN